MEAEAEAEAVEAAWKLTASTTLPTTLCLSAKLRVLTRDEEAVDLSAASTASASASIL